MPKLPEEWITIASLADVLPRNKIAKITVLETRTECNSATCTGTS
jgi:hypothetical protein